MESATSHAFPISNNLYSVALQTPTWSAYIRQFWTTTHYSDTTTIEYHCSLLPHTSNGTSTRNAYNCAQSTSTRDDLPARTVWAGALYTLTGDNLPARTDALLPPTHQPSDSGVPQPPTTKDIVSAGTEWSDSITEDNIPAKKSWKYVLWPSSWSVKSFKGWINKKM